MHVMSIFLSPSLSSFSPVEPSCPGQHTKWVTSLPVLSSLLSCERKKHALFNICSADMSEKARRDWSTGHILDRKRKPRPPSCSRSRITLTLHVGVDPVARLFCWECEAVSVHSICIHLVLSFIWHQVFEALCLHGCLMHVESHCFQQTIMFLPTVVGWSVMILRTTI